MRVLLVSTYELGHQPVHVASPAAALRAGGHDVRAIDVSVQAWDRALVDWADGVAFSVPMHTAMRMAVALAASVRARDLTSRSASTASTQACGTTRRPLAWPTG